MGKLVKFEEFESNPSEVNEGLDDVLFKLNYLRNTWGKAIKKNTLIALDKVAAFIWKDREITGALDTITKKFGKDASDNFIHSSVNQGELVRRREVETHREDVIAVRKIRARQFKMRNMKGFIKPQEGDIDDDM